MFGDNFNGQAAQQPVMQQPQMTQQPAVQPNVGGHMQAQQMPQQDITQPFGLNFQVFDGNNQQVQQQGQPDGTGAMPVEQALQNNGENIEDFIDKLYGVPAQQAAPVVPQQIQPMNFGQMAAPVIQPTFQQSIVNTQANTGAVSTDDLINMILASQPGMTRDNIVAAIEQRTGKKISPQANALPNANPNGYDTRLVAMEQQFNQALAKQQEQFITYVQQQQQQIAQQQYNENQKYLAKSMKELANKYGLSTRDVLRLPDEMGAYLQATQGGVPRNLSSVNLEDVYLKIYGKQNAMQTPTMNAGYTNYPQQQYPQQQYAQQQMPVQPMQMQMNNQQPSEADIANAAILEFFRQPNN